MQQGQASPRHPARIPGRPAARRGGLASASWRGLGGAVAAALVAAVVGGVAVEGTARRGDAGTPTDAVALSALPPEAQATHRLILQGGPFPYEKDGTIFFNRERLLPAQARGHYREYSVRTPGLSHRGARRIVCGGQPPTQPDTCYYTADHYASFRRIVP